MSDTTTTEPAVEPAAAETAADTAERDAYAQGYAHGFRAVLRRSPAGRIIAEHITAADVVAAHKRGEG